MIQNAQKFSHSRQTSFLTNQDTTLSRKTMPPDQAMHLDNKKSHITSTMIEKDHGIPQGDLKIFSAEDENNILPQKFEDVPKNHVVFSAEHQHENQENICLNMTRSGSFNNASKSYHPISCMYAHHPPKVGSSKLDPNQM